MQKVDSKSIIPLAKCCRGPKEMRFGENSVGFVTNRTFSVVSNRPHCLYFEGTQKNKVSLCCHLFELVESTKYQVFYIIFLHVNERYMEANKLTEPVPIVV